MKGYRHAALCLHGMTEDDRQWLLAQLPSPQRTRLVDMLNELDSMGIRAAQPGLRPTFLDLLEDPVPDAADPVVEHIDRVPPEAIAAATRTEPDCVVLVILGAHDWSWREAYMAGLEPGRQQRLAVALNDARKKFPSHVTATVLAALRGRLQEFPAVSEVPATANVHRRPTRLSAGRFGVRRIFARFAWQG